MNLSRFPLDRPDLGVLPGENKYPFELNSDFVYLWPGYGDWAGFPVCVPKGYQTDLLSIPKPLWPVLSPFGAGCWGALPHDILYSSHAVSRDMADRILYDAAIDSGASRFLAGILYSGVRVGGGGPWNASKPEDVSDDLQALVEASDRWSMTHSL